MDSLLQAIDFKALGVGGILLAYAMYQNHILRKDLEGERAYSKDLNEKLQEFATKATTAMSKANDLMVRMEQALRDLIR